MPKGPKSIKVMCAELGMDAGAEMMFRKDVLHFLQRQISDLPNASDDTIEPVAWEFLDTGGGAKHFSWDAALNYQWEAGEHRMTISQYVSDIMKMQRWYAIDRLHHRIDGAAKCPGCLVHPPKEMTPEFPYGSTHANHRVDNIVITSDGKFASLEHRSASSVQASIFSGALSSGPLDEHGHHNCEGTCLSNSKLTSLSFLSSVRRWKHSSHHKQRIHSRNPTTAELFAPE